MNTFGKVSRCIFPGGKAVLAAHDERGKFILGLVCHPRSVAKWARQGITRADEIRMNKALKEEYIEKVPV